MTIETTTLVWSGAYILANGILAGDMIVKSDFDDDMGENIQKIASITSVALFGVPMVALAIMIFLISKANSYLCISAFFRLYFTSHFDRFTRERIEEISAMADKEYSGGGISNAARRLFVKEMNRKYKKP